MIKEIDVINVGVSLKKVLTNDQIKEVLELYPSEQRNDPTGTWELVIEHCINLVVGSETAPLQTKRTSNQVTSNQVRDLLSGIRMGLVDTICELIKEKGAIEVKFNEPLCYQFIDDQANQSIDRVNAEQRNIEIDCGGFGEDYSIKLSELDTDRLLSILEVIENDDFEIWEEISEE
jgi:hypothetical protein